MATDTQKKCTMCGGAGVINTGGGQKTCPRCGGTGIDPKLVDVIKRRGRIV